MGLFGRRSNPTGYNPDGVMVADFNHDGKLDLVVANACGNDPTCKTTGTISVFLGNGDGTFKPQVGYTAGGFTLSVAVGDFNRDGVPDIVASNFGFGGSGNTVSVYLGNGDGTFQPQMQITAGDGPQGITVGDFNGDGKLDLAVADFIANTVSVLFGNGDGTFRQLVSFATGLGPDSLAIGTFDGDKIPDLAVTDEYGDTIRILLNTSADSLH